MLPESQNHLLVVTLLSVPNSIDSGLQVSRVLLGFLEEVLTREASGVQGFLAHKKQPPLGTYSGTMSRVLGGS